MRNVLAIVGTIALSTAAYAQNDPQVINPRLVSEGPAMSYGKLPLRRIRWSNSDHVGWQDERADMEARWLRPLCHCAHGRVFAGITCYDAGQLVIISKDGKALKSYSQDDAGGALTGANDGTPDGNGGAYFTLSGPWESSPIAGRVVHLTADGKLIEAADDLHYANGHHQGKGRPALRQRIGGRPSYLI